MTPKIQVLGLGNILRSDDGIGVRVIEHLRSTCLPNVTFTDGGTLGFQLANWLDHTAGLIVVDAAELRCEPGMVVTFKGNDMDDFIAKLGYGDAHSIGITSLLHIMRLQGTLLNHRAIIAIQYKSLDWGLNLTPPVLQALPIVAQQVTDLIAQWRMED